MPLIALTRTAHENKGWARYSSYEFAARQTLAALVASELPRAMMNLPIGFARLQDRFHPVAILSFEESRNLFVNQNGKWIGGYIPATFRAYPFALMNTKEGEKVLCFDDSSGLLVEAPRESHFRQQVPPRCHQTGSAFLQQVGAIENALAPYAPALKTR